MNLSEFICIFVASCRRVAEFVLTSDGMNKKNWLMKRTLTSLVFLGIALASMTAQTVVSHPWSGKKVAYFGDSITDPNVKASKTKYWGFLEEWLQITPLVYGVSGREWNDIPRQADRLKQEHGEDFDAILIFMGTNDYNNAVPIGHWYEEKLEKVEYGLFYDKRPEDRMRRKPVMDNDTYRGRINIALDSLKRMFPTKQIVLLTPIHRAGFYAGNQNWQCSEDYVNRCGEYLDAYVEATKEAGRVWAVPVIDLSTLCGLYPLLDSHKSYFKNAETDCLHPNDAGHQRMARTLMYQLLALPCTF